MRNTVMVAAALSTILSFCGPTGLRVAGADDASSANAAADRAERAAERAERAAERSEAAAKRVEDAMTRIERIIERYERAEAGR